MPARSATPKLSAALLAVLLAACAQAPAPGPTLPPAATRQPTAPGESSTVTQLPATPSPSAAIQPTASLSLIQAPKWTPWPKLPTEAALQTAMSIYENNGGCQLPCVWGVTPGVTSLRNVHERFSPLGYVDISYAEFSGRLRYIAKVPIREEGSSVGYFYIFFELYDASEDDIVDQINVAPKWIMPVFDYSPSGILALFGQPEQLWVSIRLDNILKYTLVYYYPQQGVVFTSMGPILGYDALGSLDELKGLVSICPDQNPPYAFFDFWSAKRPEVGENILNNMFTIDSDIFYLLEDKTDLDPASYYQIYKDPDTTACFEYRVD